MKLQSFLFPVIAASAMLACGEAPAAETEPVTPRADQGNVIVVRDTVIADGAEASATTEPVLAAILATKLMARVRSVTVHEGDRVAAGAVLVELDAGELDAKREQAVAALRSAESGRGDAELQAGRLRQLLADSAAPRAHLDAAEAALVRSEQAVRAARAAVAELEALAEYAVVRAPFAGTVVQRMVDPGAFVSPGVPIIRIEDASLLRVVAAMPPSSAAGFARGGTAQVSIEGTPFRGTVEGVVPVPGAALVNVQVLVANAGGRFSSGSAATLSLSGVPRRAILIPSAGLVRAGDLNGVRIRSGERVSTRWVRVGREHGGMIEVLAGIAAGDSIVVPGAPAGA